MSKRDSILGKRFNRLVAISIVGRNKWNQILYMCHCDCGGEKIATSSNLRGKNVKSCGCLHKEWMKELHKIRQTHKMSKTAEYRTWSQMKTRCNNPKDSRYKDYGGRGISVSKDWVDSFEKFYKDMGDRPSKKHSIDRIDNSRNYCKENCKWSTPKEQSSNRRKSKRVYKKGVHYSADTEFKSGHVPWNKGKRGVS